MAASLNIETLVARNKSYAPSHEALPYLPEMQALNLPPITTVVVSCVDPRVLPEKFLGLTEGEAIVFRSVGGRVNESVVRDILSLDSFFGHGRLQNLVVIHHTDCGASHFTSEGVKKEISSRHPQSQAEIEKWHLGAFDGLSVADSVLADVRSVEANVLISEAMKANTAGFVYDIKTGLITRVK